MAQKLERNTVYRRGTAFVLDSQRDFDSVEVKKGWGAEDNPLIPGFSPSYVEAGPLRNNHDRHNFVQCWSPETLVVATIDDLRVIVERNGLRLRFLGSIDGDGLDSRQYIIE